MLPTKVHGMHSQAVRDIGLRTPVRTCHHDCRIDSKHAEVMLVVQRHSVAEPSKRYDQPLALRGNTVDLRLSVVVDQLPTVLFRPFRSHRGFVVGIESPLLLDMTIPLSSLLTFLIVAI